jgi:hypothetical protein
LAEFEEHYWGLRAWGYPAKKMDRIIFARHWPIQTLDCR